MNVNFNFSVTFVGKINGKMLWAKCTMHKMRKNIWCIFWFYGFYMAYAKNRWINIAYTNEHTTQNGMREWSVKS